MKSIPMGSCLIVMHILICGALATIESASCKQQGVCACVFEDGHKIDLSKLGKRTGFPLIQDVRAGEHFIYSFNPCYPFNEGNCEKVAACQKDDFENFIAIGDVNSAKLTYSAESGILTGMYSSTDDVGKTRTSKVSFVCDPAADTPKSKVLGEGPKLTYTFVITSKYACKSEQPTPQKGCHTSYPDFTKRCEIEYDGHQQPVKVLFIRNWNGSCKFPTNKDVAVTIHSSEKTTCAGVIKRCNPIQAFSINGEICKELN